MESIHGKNIDRALASTSRVYLCGDLRRPQTLPWIFDERNEAGVSEYRQFTWDAPHLHTNATEYNYVVKGCTKVLLTDTREEFTFEAGSLFVLPPGTPYASKHRAGTRILFFKSPGGNDKRLFPVDGELKTWLSAW